MTLPKSLTTVTTFSKAIALFLFILLPFAGFYTGYKYRAGTYVAAPIVQNNPAPIPSPYPTSTAQIASIPGWKIYTNNDSHFSIEYPADWTFRDSKFGVAFRPLKSPDENKYYYINATIYSTSSPLDKTFKDYVMNEEVKAIQGNTGVNSIKPITTKSGISGYEVRWDYNDLYGKKGVHLPIVYFPSIVADNLKSVAWIALENENFSNIFDRMTPTFKFTQ